MPALLFLVLLGCFTAIAIPHFEFPGIIAKGLLYLVALAFFGVIAVAVWSLIKRRWKLGIIHLALALGCGVVTVFAFGFLMFASMFGSSEDGFADNLTIPTDVDVTEPREERDPQPGTERDAFQSALLAVLQNPGSADTTISGSISALTHLQQNDGAILRRYLASSPAWRMFEEHGNTFATRRWMVGSEWRYELHGYYTQHDIVRWAKSDIPDFQSRFTIGLSGKPWGCMTKNGD